MKLRDLTPEQIADLTCEECAAPRQSTAPVYRDGRRRRLCYRHACAVLLSAKELAKAAQVRRAYPWLDRGWRQRRPAVAGIEGLR